MRSLLFVSFTLLCASLAAQPWFPINRNGVNYYEGNTKTIAAYITDSSMAGGNMLYHTQHNIQQTENDMSCDISTACSWLGKGIVKQGDSLFVFHNEDYTPIKLSINTQPGNKWIAYSDQEYVISFMHVSTAVEMVLGVNDSVKTFTIEVKDPQGNAVTTNRFHNQSLKLSKHYGFVKAINFFAFPENGSFQRFYLPAFFDLKGNALSGEAVKNITFNEIFAFEPGDVFHHYMLKVNPGELPGSDLIADTTRVILTVISKELATDTIIYQVRRRQANIHWENDKGSYGVTTDTVTFIYTKYHYGFLDDEPGIPARYYNEFQSYYLLNDKALPAKRSLYSDVLLSADNDSCLHMMYDSYAPMVTFYKGAGVFYNFNPLYFTELTYYKKGTQTWGTPWPDNVGLGENRLSMDEVKLYPNPAVNELRISLFSQPVSRFELFDYQGKLCMVQRIEGDHALININYLQAGLYFYHLSNTNGMISGKLMIAR